MKTQAVKSVIGIIIVVLIGFGLAFAGSQNSVLLNNGVPLFGLMVGVAFLIQWIAFIPAFLFQTEKFYDITGTVSYVSVAIISLIVSSRFDLRSILVTALVTIWTVRLGTFLLKRVLSSGKDDRFDDIKPSFARFLLTWTLQGLWVSFTVSAALAVVTSNISKVIDLFLVIGLAVWLFGFIFEAVADAQKNRFRADPVNKGKFIHSGLWSLSRHPNYFGEITLWLGIAIIALPVLQGWQWVTMISPIFVTLLLTKISGVPMLEKKAETKWGGQADYEAYKKRTPVLLPRLKK